MDSHVLHVLFKAHRTTAGLLTMFFRSHLNMWYGTFELRLMLFGRKFHSMENFPQLGHRIFYCCSDVVCRWDLV